MVGEIHLASIDFTNNSGAKSRPVLIAKRNSVGDLVYFPLSTNLTRNGGVLKGNNFIQGTLPKMSIVLTDKIGVIAPSLLIRKIAAIDSSTLNNIVGEFVRFLTSKP